MYSTQKAVYLYTDEKGLYYRTLPERTYVFENSPAKGTKACKERFTLLCYASMTGEKKDLLGVGKSKPPRCFKEVKKTLPTVYYNDKSAWMTFIWQEWLVKCDKSSDRKILLLVDDCTAHVNLAHLKNI